MRTASRFSEFQYLACKLILRPNRFTSRKSLFDFGDVIQGPAAQHGVVFSMKEYLDAPVKVREVLFLDTADSRLYNHAFILRRRIQYKDGFPVGSPKSSSSSATRTCRRPPRPTCARRSWATFRAQVQSQALPLKDRLGGIRMLYSHNVQFPRSTCARV